MSEYEKIYSKWIIAVKNENYAIAVYFAKQLDDMRAKHGKQAK